MEDRLCTFLTELHHHTANVCLHRGWSSQQPTRIHRVVNIPGEASAC